ncbi:MAG: hypothetical protein KAG53_00290, partial [Endozoicomonadaceae bacterium]|nr:hypothetical protein [Endozoicomonadaceae bacterium]
NWLKGSEGDKINLLMAACAWNMRKWMIAFFLFEINGVLRAYITFKTSSSALECFYLTLQ